MLEHAIFFSLCQGLKVALRYVSAITVRHHGAPEQGKS